MLCSARGWRCDPSGLLTHGKPPPSTFNYARDIAPAGTRTSEPQGGYVLWVELPPRVDSMRLYHAALAQGITIGPGYMFSMRNEYHHYIRLNYSYPWNAQTEAALKTLGEMVAKMA